MKNAANRTIFLLNLLKSESDEQHPLSMTEIQDTLEHHGIICDRRSIYASIKALDENGYPIIFIRRKAKQGYYYQRPYMLAEALILCNAIQSTPSLDIKRSAELIHKLQSELSSHQAKRFSINPISTNKTENTEVLQNINLIIEAIQKQSSISFYYFDTTITKQKKYRRNQQKYLLTPYALVSDNGRYYCILHAEKYDTFTSYRIDKMEQVTILNIIPERKPFDLEQWMSTSFHMYRNQPDTLTAIFDISLTNILFDQFGKQILISKADEKSVTASIKISVTPTIISWLLQFYDKITILKPQALIDELKRIAEDIHQKYE